MENGFRLFPLAPGELRRSDPDIAPAPVTIAWISETHGLPVEKVHQMTAAGLYGTLQVLRTDLISTQGLKLFEAEFGAASRSDFGGAHAGQIVGRA